MSEFEILFLDLLQRFSDAAFYEKYPNIFDSTSEKHKIEMELANSYNNLREHIAIRPNIVNDKKDGATLLMLASHYKMDSYVELLLTSQHIDVNIEGNLDDHYGMTALMFAISCNNNVTKKKTGIFNTFANDPRTDIHKIDVKGKTALHLATSYGIVTATEAVLLAGADVNAQDNDGNSPLICAVKSSMIEKEKVVDVLLEFSKNNGYTLDTTIQDIQGLNARVYTEELTTYMTHENEIEADNFYVLQLIDDYDFNKIKIIKNTTNLTLFRDDKLPYDMRHHIVSYLDST